MKLIAVVLATLSLTVCAHAQIGRTLEECEQNYGHGDRITKDGGTYAFYPEIESQPSRRVNYCVLAFFVDGKVSDMLYSATIDNTDKKIYTEDAKFLIGYCMPEAVWSDPSHNNAKTEMTWDGKVNGEVKYTAVLKGTAMLEIKDDDINVGGVFGAKREMMDGHEVTVLPTPEE